MLRKVLWWSPAVIFIYWVVLQMFNSGLSSEQMADIFYWHYIIGCVWMLTIPIWLRILKRNDNQKV